MPRLPQHDATPVDGPLDRAYFDREFELLLAVFHEYMPEAGEGRLRAAYEYAYELHDGQLRNTGVPYIDHPLQVARILAHLKMDPDTLIAGLLHDTLEDCAEKGVTVGTLTERFGEHVAMLVDGVTKIGDLKFRSFEHQQSVNYRKMLLSMSRDIRVIFVKFADRLHNMRTLDGLKPEKAERIARETLEVYAPLAHRFGMGSIKWELEDLCLKILEPEFYRELVEKIDLKREEREAVIEEAVAPLRQRLAEYGLKNFRIFGRPKHFHSIWTKIHKRQKTFEEILDLFAVRIIVEKVEDCYFALGVVHNQYMPIHERFSDYIATPKTNGYQSLHTKVVGPRGRTLEVQIRTQEMHRVAEYGLAAHWIYKEGGNADEQLDQFFAWIKQVLSEDSLEESSKEFLEGFKINLYQDEIFVFSPKGDLYKLPRGSTAIDFAFAVHTNVGLTCIGAKENGRIVPLDQALSSGCTVEIITSKTPSASLDWLRIVRSTKARSRIKRWLKESQWAQSVELGEEVLRRELDKANVPLKSPEVDATLQALGYSTREKGLAAIGSGDLPIANLIRRIAPQEKPVTEGLLTRIFRRGSRGTDNAVRIQGMGNLVIQFARCCQPLPGDEIVGFVVTGRGVKVHRRNCPNISQMLAQPDRMVEVAWDSPRDQQFNTRVRLVARDRKHLIRDITETLSKLEVNILQFTMRKQDDLAIGKYILEVKDLTHLTQILKRLRAIPKVILVERHDQGADW
ncbi:MAG: bifunctional (p)ppGpp synthetase/guanosine-3',5'-bis(diphosphate) 3'-pyrophosphohydrolase [Candidatus Delongbacteria bacterium]